MLRGTGVAVVLAVCLSLSGTVAHAATPIRFFHTADGFVSCAIIKGSKKKGHHKHFVPRIRGAARCDVRNHTWAAPPRPASCDLDWGDGVEVGERGAADYVCAGDTVADASRSFTLAPGTSVTLGRFSCTAAAATMRCLNNLTGNGFEVGVATVQTF